MHVVMVVPVMAMMVMPVMVMMPVMMVPVVMMHNRHIGGGGDRGRGRDARHDRRGEQEFLEHC